MSKIRQEWLMDSNKELVELMSLWDNPPKSFKDHKVSDRQEELLDMIFPKMGNFGVTGCQGSTGVQGITGVRGTMLGPAADVRGVTGPGITGLAGMGFNGDSSGGGSQVTIVDILNILKGSSSEQLKEIKDALVEKASSNILVPLVPVALFEDDLLTKLFTEVMDPLFIKRIGRKLAT